MLERKVVKLERCNGQTEHRISQKYDQLDRKLSNRLAEIDNSIKMMQNNFSNARPRNPTAKINRSSRSNRHHNCALCEGRHMIKNCIQFLRKKVKDRADIVQRKGICSVCLRNHLKVNCPKLGKRCSFCTNEHHYLLCYSNENADACDSARVRELNEPSTSQEFKN